MKKKIVLFCVQCINQLYNYSFPFALCSSWTPLGGIWHMCDYVWFLSYPGIYFLGFYIVTHNM